MRVHTRPCRALLFGCLILAPQRALPQSQTASGGNSTVIQAPTASSEGRRIPLDVSAVVGFRTDPSEERGESDGYELAGTLFLSKNVGRWQFHSKLNANAMRELDRDGIALFRPRGHFTADVDAAWVNYGHRDELQLRSGILYIPTYWSTRRFQAATYTVADPLIDQDIFPAAFVGGMVHGDRYLEDGGFTYALYGGKGLEQDPFDAEEERIAKPRLFGGKIVAHLPVRQKLRTLDVGYHRMRGAYPGRASQWVDGLELRIDKGPLGFVGDYARARVRMADGDRALRMGYYAQTSYRLAPRWTLVGRYDNAVVRVDDPEREDRLTAGFAFRPRPELWLKADALVQEVATGDGSARWGVSFGITYFFEIR